MAVPRGHPSAGFGQGEGAEGDDGQRAGDGHHGVGAGDVAVGDQVDGREGDDACGREDGVGAEACHAPAARRRDKATLPGFP